MRDAVRAAPRITALRCSATCCHFFRRAECCRRLMPIMRAAPQPRAPARKDAMAACAADAPQDARRSRLMRAGRAALRRHARVQRCRMLAFRHTGCCSQRYGFHVRLIARRRCGSAGGMLRGATCAKACLGVRCGAYATCASPSQAARCMAATITSFAYDKDAVFAPPAALQPPDAAAPCAGICQRRRLPIFCSKDSAASRATLMRVPFASRQ